MRSRAERRKNKYRIINKRRNLLSSIYDISGIVIGKLANNNIVNEIAHGGRTIKTNSRKAQQNYRHHGLYGTEKCYVPRDQRSIDRMEEQENEYYQSEGNGE